MYSIILQESLKKNMFCHKENNWQVFEKQRFPPNFNGPSCFNKNFNHKDHFPKKIALPIIFHMPPWWPMYLDLGLSNSSFCAGLFSTVSAQTGLNWFLLSIQTAKSSTTKKYLCYRHQDFWTKYFFFLWYDDVNCAKDSQR